MPEETAVNAAPVVAGGGGAPASEPAPAQVSEPQGSTEPAAQSAEPAGSGQTQSTADNNIVASANTGDGKRFVIEKDPVTGKRTVKKIDAEPVAAEQNAEPAVEPEPANSPTAELIDRVAGEVGAVPEPYDLNEFSAALAAGDVDERRVPQEFQKQYTEFRIAQAVEAFKEKQAEEARQKEQLQKQLSPEEQAKDELMVNNIIPFLRKFGHNIRIYNYRIGRKPDLEIAGTGHRFFTDNPARLKEQIKKQLEKYSKTNRVVVRTCFAHGADQLIAECANEMGITTKAVLPVGYEDYIKMVRSDCLAHGYAYTEKDELKLRHLLAQTVVCKVVSSPDGGYEAAIWRCIRRKRQIPEKQGLT